jgi:hypothetical protein
MQSPNSACGAGAAASGTEASLMDRITMAPRGTPGHHRFLREADQPRVVEFGEFMLAALRPAEFITIDERGWGQHCSVEEDGVRQASARPTIMFRLHQVGVLT